MTTRRPPVPLWCLVGGFIAALLAARAMPGWGAAISGLLALGVAVANYRWGYRKLLFWPALGIAGGMSAWLAMLATTPFYELENDYKPLRLKQTEVRITDARCAPELTWLGDPFRVRANWEGMPGVSAGTVELEGLGRLGMHPAYGDQFRVTGTLFPPSRFGAPAVVRVDAVDSPVVSVPGMQGHLLRLRNWTLAILTRDLANDRDRNTMAGMLFGCTQGLEREDRAVYARVGVIHLFSVSGLHIGLLSGVLLAALFWCPFRLRHWLALSVIFYVAMTGWQTPAVRALVMFGVWCAARAQLYRIPTLRLVALAALVILAYAPRQLWELGFQFSFLVTAALIAAMPDERRWRLAISETNDWRYAALNRKRSVKWPSKIRQKLTSALFAAAIAYLAGCAITLYYQGVFAPVSVLANLGLIPIVTLLYPVAALQLAVGWLPGVRQLLAGLSDTLLAGMDGVIQLADSGVGVNGLVTPGVGMLSLFYLGLAWLLLGVSRRWLGWCGMVAALLIWSVSAWRLPPAIGVFHDPYRDRPTIVISEPAIGRARVIGAPEYENRLRLIAWLGGQGIRRIASVTLPSSDGRELLNAIELTRKLPVDDWWLPSEMTAPGWGRRRANEGWIPEKNGFRAGFRLTRHEIVLHLSGHTLSVAVDGVPQPEIEIMRRNRPEVWSYELE